MGSPASPRHFSRTRFGAIRDLLETCCLTGRSVGPGSSPGKNEFGVGAALSDPLCCLPSPWGEGVAERRMRGISTQAPGFPPHPAFGHPLSGERERRRLFSSPRRGEVGRRAASGRWGRASASVPLPPAAPPLRLALAGDPPPHIVGRKVGAHTRLPIFPGRASARSAVLPSFSLGRRCRGATDEGDQHPGTGMSPSPGLRPPSPGGEGKAAAVFFPTAWGGKPVHPCLVGRNALFRDRAVQPGGKA